MEKYTKWISTLVDRSVINYLVCDVVSLRNIPSINKSGKDLFIFYLLKYIIKLLFYLLKYIIYLLTP